MKSQRKIKRKINYESESDYLDEDEDDNYSEDQSDSYKGESDDNEEDESGSEEISEILSYKKKKKSVKKKPLEDKSQTKEKKFLGNKRKVITKTEVNIPKAAKPEPLTPITKPQTKQTQSQSALLPQQPFDLNKEYFYQNLTNSEWQSIAQFIDSTLSSSSLPNQQTLHSFFNQHLKLTKGQHNITKLLQILNDKSKSHPSSLLQYQTITSYIISTYLMVKPSIFQVYFFPNEDNEIKVTNMLKTSKESIDIAIFTMTNTRIASVIEDAFNRHLKIRVIADDECCKMWGSSIYHLAAIGIDVKTDDSVRYHMHHKFAVIDNSVVITGSFNWTTQAVRNNQENVLFLENKDLARKYEEEFQRLWDDFETVITKESAVRIIKDQDDKKRAMENRKKKAKDIKMMKKQEMKMEQEGEGNNGKEKEKEKKVRQVKSKGKGKENVGRYNENGGNDENNGNLMNCGLNEDNGNCEGLTPNKSSCMIF